MTVCPDAFKGTFQKIYLKRNQKKIFRKTFKEMLRKRFGGTNRTKCFGSKNKC